MVKLVKPMLAATIDTAEQLADIRYPVLVSPKLDGVRCLVDEDGVPYSRNGKRFANPELTVMFNTFKGAGYDGELGMGNPTEKEFFGRTSGWLRRLEDDHPDQPITYWVFDTFDSSLPFVNRLPYHWNTMAGEQTSDFKEVSCITRNFSVRLVQQELCYGPDEVLAWEEKFTSMGYEGIIIRGDIHKAPYKHGRSTLRSQELLKFKRFADAEGVIIGFEAANENQNEAEEDAYGHTTRSSAKAGLVAIERMGKMIVRCDKFEEPVLLGTGIGLTHELRDEIWANQDKYLGKTVTFAFQLGSDYVKPRFPSFKGFRDYE